MHHPRSHKALTKLHIAATFLCTGLAILVGCNEAAGIPVNLSAADNRMTTESIERHPSGRISASGAVLPGTTTRVGRWTMWYDDESGPKRWEGEYTNGVMDQSKPWREWNADGSVRADAEDQ
jgi:hypothetical protein